MYPNPPPPHTGKEAYIQVSGARAREECTSRGAENYAPPPPPHTHTQKFCQCILFGRNSGKDSSKTFFFWLVETFSDVTSIGCHVGGLSLPLPPPPPPYWKRSIYNFGRAGKRRVHAGGDSGVA